MVHRHFRLTGIWHSMELRPLAGRLKCQIIGSPLPERKMTSLSPADAERLKLAFQRCRDMEGTLNEQLRAYAKAGREIFPAYGEAVDRLVERLVGNGGGENAPRPGEVCRISYCLTRTGI